MGAELIAALAPATPDTVFSATLGGGVNPPNDAERCPNGEDKDEYVPCFDKILLEGVGGIVEEDDKTGPPYGIGQ